MQIEIKVNERLKQELRALIQGDETAEQQDSEDQVKGVWKGNKRQISITLAPELLDRVDELAEKLGQSRAAVIGMAVYRAVEHGLLKD